MTAPKTITVNVKIAAEDNVTAFIILAESYLHAATQLTDWPERHRLKQIQADLSEVRDDFEDWLAQQWEAQQAEPVVRHRSAITGHYVTEAEAAANPDTTVRIRAIRASKEQAS